MNVILLRRGYPFNLQNRKALVYFHLVTKKTSQALPLPGKIFATCLIFKIIGTVGLQSIGKGAVYAGQSSTPSGTGGKTVIVWTPACPHDHRHCRQVGGAGLENTHCLHGTRGIQTLAFNSFFECSLLSSAAFVQNSFP